MLEIDQLIFSGIGRFVEEQMIDFTKLGKLAQVDGIRSDSSGSSGSGKSTVFNALEYVFGINVIPASVLQSRFTKDAMSATMIGKYIGKKLIIHRTKGKISVELDGEKIGGSKLCEEKILEIMGMPGELFRPLLHKRQKEGGFFLRFTPAEKVEFLTDCLGLGEIRKKQALIDKKIAELEKVSAEKLSQLDQAVSGWHATQKAVLAIGEPPIQEVDASNLTLLKGLSDAAQADVDPIKSRHAQEVQSLESSRPVLASTGPTTTIQSVLEGDLVLINLKITKAVQVHSEAKDKEARRAHSAWVEVQALILQKEDMRRSVLRANEAKATAEQVALEIKKIRSSLCPTCEQGWATDAAKKRESDLLAKIGDLKATIEVGMKAKQALPELDANIEAFRPQMVTAEIPMPAECVLLAEARDAVQKKIQDERQHQSELTRALELTNKMAQDQFATQARDLAQIHRSELEHFRGQAEVTRRAFEIAAQKFKSYESDKMRYENTLANVTAQASKYRADSEKLSEELNLAKDDLVLAEELKKATKTYMSCLFDEALEYISTQATEIVRSIPNMANATIQLIGTKENKDGKVKEEVNAVLSMDGFEGIPIKSLSGGEHSSADLAVDLAVLDLLENKTNKGINLFILDEPFTGLDPVSIEMAIEKLRTLNKRLILVDHNSELKAMVESRLVAVREGNISRIEQN